MGCWVLVGLRRVRTGWQAACLKNTADEDEGEVEAEAEVGRRGGGRKRMSKRGREVKRVCRLRGLRERGVGKMSERESENERERERERESDEGSGELQRLKSSASTLSVLVSEFLLNP